MESMVPPLHEIRQIKQVGSICHLFDIDFANVKQIAEIEVDLLKFHVTEFTGPRAGYCY